MIAELKRRDADHMLVVVGGIIPDADIPTLEAAGVARVFTPGTSTIALAEYIRTAIEARRSATASEE